MTCMVSYLMTGIFQILQVIYEISTKCLQTVCQHLLVYRSTFFLQFTARSASLQGLQLYKVYNFATETADNCQVYWCYTKSLGLLMYMPFERTHNSSNGVIG